MTNEFTEYKFEDFAKEVLGYELPSPIKTLLEAHESYVHNINAKELKDSIKAAKTMQKKRDYNKNLKQLNDLDLEQGDFFDFPTFQKKKLTSSQSPDWILVPAYQVYKSLLWEIPDDLVQKILGKGVITTEDGQDRVIWHIPVEKFIALCYVQQKLNKVNLKIAVDKSTVNRTSKELEVQVVNPKNPLVS